MASCKKLFTRFLNPSLTPHPNKLVTLDLRGCKSLQSIPTITHLKFLKELDLSYCSKLKRLPEISSGNLERMILNGTAIEELPSSIVCLSSLLELHLSDCKSLQSLPSNLSELKSLKQLNLLRCSNLQGLPEELGNLQSLKDLCLYGCSNLQRLPDKLENLEALTDLNTGGTAIREVPSIIFRLKHLNVFYFCGTRSLWPTLLSLDGSHSITRLHLIDCGITELPDSLGQLFSLNSLLLWDNEFERISESIIQLSKLRHLSVRHCKRLQSLPKLPILHSLQTDGCTSLESVPALFSSNEYPMEQCIELGGNFKLDGNEIVKDALQKFQLKATARWKHIWEKVYYGRIAGHVILPGNEIPRWFRYQSMGSAVSLEGTVPGLFNNNKVIGFAFSAVLAHHVRCGWLFFKCQFKYESKDADGLDFHMRAIEKDCCVKSDHIILGYYFFRYEEFNDFNKLNCLPYTFHVNFKYSPISKPWEDYCPVKKCGIHLFYAPEDSTVQKKRSCIPEDSSSTVPKKRSCIPKD